MKFLLAILLSITVIGGNVKLKPGDKAPDFHAETTTGTHISLRQYRGKDNVILYFYPLDLSKGCSIEACSFRDHRKQFAAAHTVILGVSMQDRAMHEKFTKSDKLNFPLLVDTHRTIAKEYGVPLAFKKYDARWTFLIGKDGKIVKTYHHVNPITHIRQLLQDIAANTREHAK